MKRLICIMVCFSTLAGFGQTKLIAFKSHSGSNTNFRIAIEHNLFDIDNSNFGLRITYIDKIDTVILKTNYKIIVLRKRSRMINGMVDKTVSFRDTLTSANAAIIFKANSMDSLKIQIHKMYKTSKIDSTLFIGFNEKFKLKKV